jgi:hypothetical protein
MSEVLGILFLIGFALTLLIVDGMLGGFTGGLIGLVSALILRRGSWELILPRDTLAGAVGFTVLQLAALGLTQLKVQIHQYASPAIQVLLASLYDHTFRVGFAGAILAPILYELWRGSQPKSLP